MTRPPGRLFHRLGAVAAVAVLSACASDPKVETVRRFNDARERGDLAAARALMTPDARIWFENPVGEGAPWSIGEGAWARWDAHFESRNRHVGDYQRDGDAVFVIVEEDNGYYRLTDRVWSRTMLTWFVNDDLRIRGFMVAAVGESVSRAAEFRRWASEHEPEEFAALFPAGRIDPSHPARMEALLRKWRAAAGLPPLAEARE